MYQFTNGHQYHQCINYFNPPRMHLVCLLRIHCSVGGKENGVVRLAVVENGGKARCLRWWPWSWGDGTCNRRPSKIAMKCYESSWEWLNMAEWTKMMERNSQTWFNFWHFLSWSENTRSALNFGPLRKRPKLDTLVLCSGSPPGTKAHSLALWTPWSCESLKKLKNLQDWFTYVQKLSRWWYKVVQFQTNWTTCPYLPHEVNKTACLNALIGFEEGKKSNVRPTPWDLSWWWRFMAILS